MLVNYLQTHERFGQLYEGKIEEEVEYISSHFFELCEGYKDDLKALKNETLERIISHSQLKLKNEDQLVKFINFLYTTAGEVKSEYSKLYGYVIFTNVSSSAIGEFLDEIGKDDLTEEAWNSISHRLRQAIPKNQQTEQPGRYRGKMFLPRGERV